MAITYTMVQLLDRLGLEYTRSNNLDCPFCGKKKKLHFSNESNFWKCPVCSASGGVLHFYARYQLGMETLPPSKEEKGALAEKLREFMGDSNSDMQRVKGQERKAPPAPAIVPVADDNRLHTIYSAMAALPIFQLQPAHKKELMRRGLSATQVERNGYRSYPAKSEIPPYITDIYNAVDPKLKEDHTTRKANQIKLGLYVAKTLEADGHKLDGIPGFYKFGPHWCLTYCPGILIPTRNILGQIVIWQVRRNIDPKYMTLSCGSLPGAVTASVSRCHFPLGNHPLSDVVKTVFTEGPLKADVACALHHDPATFVAIPGINTTKDLLAHSEMFRKAGITQLHNALDMDKLTNPNVRKGSNALCDALRKRGLQVIPMYWGDDYAEYKLFAYRLIAKARGVFIPAINPSFPIFEKLNIVADALNRADIDPGRMDGGLSYWDPSSKGIDDYLFSLNPKSK